MLLFQGVVEKGKGDDQWSNLLVRVEPWDVNAAVDTRKVGFCVAQVCEDPAKEVVASATVASGVDPEPLLRSLAALRAQLRADGCSIVCLSVIFFSSLLGVQI